MTTIQYGDILTFITAQRYFVTLSLADYCHFNCPFVHPRNFKRLCMGNKVPPCSVSDILDNWSRTVSRIIFSCTTIQAESNKLFLVIIKCAFVEICRKFQMHCFCRFPLDLRLQRLREGQRHLLVINPMRAVGRGGCDSTVALMTVVVAATADIHGVGDVLLDENVSTQCVYQTCKTARHPTHRRHRRH